MSFYGNSYYYTAETFAKVILNNTGRDITTLPLESQFKKSPIEIDALHRKSGVGFDTGNHWIGLEVDGKDSIVKVWHNKPADFGTLTTVGGFETISKPPAGLTPTDIGFESYIQAPQITYDAAGHITTPIGCRYFKMPSDPTVPFLIRLQNIDGLTEDEGKNATLNSKSLKEDLEDQMDDLKSRMETIDGIGSDNAFDSDGDSVKAELLKRMDDMENPNKIGSLAYEAKQLNEAKTKIDTVYNRVFYSQPEGENAYTSLVNDMSVLKQSMAQLLERYPI